MNIKNLRAQTDVELEAVQTRRRKAKAEIELILDEARKEGRPNLSDDEQKRTDSLFATIEMSKAQEIGVKDKLARIVKVEAEEAEFDSQLNAPAVPSGAARNGDRQTASVSVGREARTYSRETDPFGKLFLSDVINQFVSNDLRSADRLGRHIREEQVERAHESWQKRGVGEGTGAFSGLTVPQYLLDMVAPAVANMRPFADKANKHPLPEFGMSVNISRITTASTAALQSPELQAVSWTDMGDTLLTIPIRTAAGQQLISRQAIERGQGIEDVVLQDLMKRYNTVVDTTVINTATAGLQTVANPLAYTDAAPTATALYPLIVGAVSQSATATRGEAMPNFVLMHPRRWYWMQSALVTSWPAFGQPNINPRNIGNGGDDQQYNTSGYNGYLPCGVNVIADANVVTNLGVGTNQDVLYVGSLDEVHLWEDTGAPVFIRAEQPSVANLGINLVVYGYFAFTMQRYALAFQSLTGTGTVQPTGF